MIENLKGNKAIVYLTERGRLLAQKIIEFYPDCQIYRFDKSKIAQIWQSHRVIIFIMATGIAVRSIAPFIKDKKTDPAVLVMDEDEKHIIPILGGHLQGANEIAKTLSNLLKAEAVITTGSDLKNSVALDLWIKRCGLRVKNPDLLPKIMSKLIEKGKIKIFKEQTVKVPLRKELEITEDPSEADIIITNKTKFLSLLSFTEEDSSIKDKAYDNGNALEEKRLVLIPQNLFIGIGFHDWITQEEIESAVKETLSKNGLLFEGVKAVATINRKANHEALKGFCEKYGLKLYGFTSEELNKAKSFSYSETVFKTVGVSSVSEQSCLIASRGKLIVPKQVFNNITVAIAESNFKVKGKLYIVGIGPGSLSLLTPIAIKALRDSELIVGYKTYIQQILSLLEDKEVVSYSMTEEVQRAKRAVEEVLKGRIVSLISGGDPGIYGMAGVVLEILSKNEIDIDLEIIPGISALNACSSKVGAPVINDFAVVSLSDRLTPWKTIEKRLEMSAKADFVIVIYNPKSMARQSHLTKAKEIILKYRSGDTPVAIVKGAMRENESVTLTTLEEIDKHPVDMQTTVIVGNSKTFIYKEWMITPRGYEEKYDKQYKLNGSSLG